MYPTIASCFTQGAISSSCCQPPAWVYPEAGPLPVCPCHQPLDIPAGDPETVVFEAERGRKQCWEEEGGSCSVSSSSWGHLPLALSLLPPLCLYFLAIRKACPPVRMRAPGPSSSPGRSCRPLSEVCAALVAAYAQLLSSMEEK